VDIHRRRKRGRVVPALGGEEDLSGPGMKSGLMRRGLTNFLREGKRKELILGIDGEEKLTTGREGRFRCRRRAFLNYTEVGKRGTLCSSKP